MNAEPHMSVAEALPTIREAVAACYHVRLQVLNGGPWYQNKQYRIRMEVTPDVIASAIQNNIEGALIEEYGPEQGAINAADMLSAMIDDTKHFDRTGGLSELGVTVMDELFKSLAEMARDWWNKAKPLLQTWAFRFIRGLVWVLSVRKGERKNTPHKEACGKIGRMTEAFVRYPKEFY